MNRRHVPAALMALGAFLAPWIGGGFLAETQPLAAGALASFAAVFEGSPAPSMAHLLIGLPFALALHLALRGRAVQTASLRVLLPMFALFAVLAMSVLVSDFRFLSAHTWFFWSSYPLVLIAAVAACGRQSGPKAVLGALVAGGCLVALKGKVEYDQMRVLDPTWRIFGGWTNPNALAGMLVLCLFPALGLTVVARRPWNLASGASAVAIAYALLLTGSKGGLVSAAAGAVVFLAFAAAWGGVRKAATGVLPLALAAVLAVALGEAGSATGEAPLGRVANASPTQTQSTRFRKLLWRSAVQIAADQPLGVGLGAYRHSSARPGLTEQTVLAHNTFLQLAAEASPLALLLFVGMLLAWGYEMVRGARSLACERNLLRAAVIAAVAASLAHGLADSDLWFFGIGVGFFMLLGVGLQLAADASGPELTPGTFRGAAAAAAVGLLLIQGYFAAMERWKSRVLGDLASDPVRALEGAKGLATWAPSDGEAWAMLARLTPPYPPSERLRPLTLAADLAPSTRNLRALAAEHERLRHPGSAEDCLKSALRRDPNNLRTLAALWQFLDRQGRTKEAEAVAWRTVGVEGKAYFQVRALPELVPTETFDARLFLARTSADPGRLLLPAIEGYGRYARSTVPLAVRAAKAGATLGGVSIEDVRQVIQRAEEAARRLEKLDAGKEAAATVASALAAFAEANRLLEDESNPR